MFTYDFSSDKLLSTVRLLVGDTDSTKPIFDDAEVRAAIAVESDTFVSGMVFNGGAGTSYASSPASPRRAAAVLLDVLAANKSRLAGVISVLDVKLGVDKAAQELRASAKALRDTEADSGAFAIAEVVHDQFAARERIQNILLRLTGSG